MPSTGLILFGYIRHPWGLVWMWPFGKYLQMPGCFVHTLPFSSPCDAMLTMFVCATRWLSMHLNKLAHMSMHESCLLLCRPCFNTIKSWTFDPNLHLSLVDTTFCFAFLLVYLLACLLAFLFLCLPCLSCLSALCLFHMPFASFLPLLVCWFLVFAMYTYGVRAHGAKVRSPRHKQKGRWCKHVDISQAAMFSRFRGLASSIWLCTLLNPFPSSLISLIDGLY